MSEGLSLDTATEPQPTVAYLRLMAASVLCMVMFGAVQVIPAVCLEALGRSLHLNFEQRGLLTATRMAALIASLLVVGYLGEGSARRHLLFWGLLAIAGGQVIAGRALSYPPLLGSMVVSGLGFGIVEALVNPLVAQLHPRGSARALNMVNGLFSLGLVFGALTTGELLEAGLSWRLPFLVWIAPPLVCAVLYFTPRYPAASPEDAGRPAGGAARFLRQPLFWVLILAMVLGGGCEAGLTTWAPNFTAQALGASAREGAWATILYGAFMALGRFASGLLVTRITPLRLMILSAVGCAAATLGVVYVPALWGAWALFAAAGFFVACFWPTLLSVASDHIATGSTPLFSLLAAAGVGGCVVVPWAIGALGDAYHSLRIAMMLLPASMVLLIALLLLAARIIDRREPQ